MKSCPSNKILKTILIERCILKPKEPKEKKPKEPKEPKKCPSGKILSPKGRCVKKDGPTAKKMFKDAAPKKEPKEKKAKEPKEKKAKEPKEKKAKKEPKEKKAKEPKEKKAKKPEEPKKPMKPIRIVAGNIAYELLGVNENITSAELKKAFRKKALEYHPDKNENNSSAKRKFQAINIAYDILKDPEYRRYYNNFKNIFTYDEMIRQINKMNEIKNRSTYAK